MSDAFRSEMCWFTVDAVAAPKLLLSLLDVAPIVIQAGYYRVL